MKNTLTLTAFGFVILMLGNGPASAGWQRQASVSTPAGTYSSTRSGSCGGGQCSRSGTVTGPYGGTVSRNGATSCSGGTCTHTGSVAVSGVAPLPYPPPRVIYVAPPPPRPVVYLPAPPIVYLPPPRPLVWIPGHWVGLVWVPGHWS